MTVVEEWDGWNNGDWIVGGGESGGRWESGW